LVAELLPVEALLGGMVTGSGCRCERLNVGDGQSIWGLVNGGLMKLRMNWIRAAQLARVK
jgi:hypothetical protein